MTLRLFPRTLVPLLVLALVALSFSYAEARAGRGRSFGSRGSTSYRAPARPAPPYTSANPSQNPAAGQWQPFGAGQRGGFLRGLAGGMVGGLVGGMLFRGLGIAGPTAGMGGGVGIFEIALLAAGGYLLYRFVAARRRGAQARAPAWSAGPGMFQPEGAPSHDCPDDGGWAAADPAPGDSLAAGLSRIRQTDPSFREADFRDTAQDIFFRVQAAWTRRDLASVEASLGVEVRRSLQEDIDELKGRGEVNRLENIAVREARIVEASQDQGQEMVTVHLLASLLDFTTDEMGRVHSGSEHVPVKFEEYWTFRRPVGPGPWTLASIQQA